MISPGPGVFFFGLDRQIRSRPFWAKQLLKQLPTKDSRQMTKDIIISSIVHTNWWSVPPLQLIN